MKRISIIIPAYNEEEAIGDDLDVVLQTMKAGHYDFEVIVVDDGSTDRTAEIVAEKEGVILLRHDHNRGTGAARTTGLKRAQGDIVVMTDGDGSYPNQDIPRLLHFMDEYAMVIGARSRETGSWRWLRVPMKSFICTLASYLTDSRIPDLNSGFRAFRRKIALRYLGLLPNSHSWVGTITLAFLKDGYGVKYIPIDYYPRKGRSKFRPIRDTYNYLALVIRTIVYFDPIRVFFPLALILGSIGGVKTIHDIFRYHWHLAPSTVVILLAAIQIGAFGLLADLIVRRSSVR